jgi:membrane fusion protein, multidrug efflux system
MKRLIILGLVLGVLIALKLIFFPGKGQKREIAKDQTGQAAGVSVYIVKNETLSYDLNVAGGLQARESVELAAETGGAIRKILFREGSKVEKGTLLVKLNDDELQAQLRKQELNLKLGLEKLSRMEKLLTVKGTSQEEYDVLNNEVEVLKADIQYTKAQIARTEIRAPFSGIVGLRSISEGAVVQSGVALIAMVQQELLLLDFSIPERYSASVKKGMPVQFRIDQLKEEFVAEISALEPRIEEGTRTLRIRAEYRNNDGRLLPGMSARVNLILAANPEALMIPTQAVIPILKGQKVFIVQSGKAKEVKILTGFRQADRIEVIDGLHNGDSLITTGIMSIREGMPVRAISDKVSGGEATK